MQAICLLFVGLVCNSVVAFAAEPPVDEDSGLPASVLEKLGRSLPEQTVEQTESDPQMADAGHAPVESSDVSRWRMAQQTIRQQKQTRQPGSGSFALHKDAPEFASHCVKMEWQSDGRPAFRNSCGKPVKIAYCWYDWDGEHGALACDRHGMGLSEAGAIQGPSLHDGKYAIVWFACTAPGLPTAVEVNRTPLSARGQCHW